METLWISERLLPPESFVQQIGRLFGTRVVANRR
jgi:hypothetical protein